MKPPGDVGETLRPVSLRRQRLYPLPRRQIGERNARTGVTALPHLIASFSIAAGVSLFELDRFMSTSVDQIDKTDGHLLPDSIDRTRSALDTYLSSASGGRIRLGHVRATPPPAA